MDKQQPFQMRQQPRTLESQEKLRARLVRRLERASGRTLCVRFHRNRWTYFSCQARGAGAVLVRLHEAFLEAPPTVITAVARLIRHESAEARRTIGAFVDERSRVWDELADRPPRPLVIQTKGRIYDLQAIFNGLNLTYFDGECGARITWGRGQRAARNRNQITFGTFDETANLIRIHPILDRRTVPEHFIQYIVYHEMLHAVLPPTVSPSGRRLYHSRLFRQRERMFTDFARAQRWGKRFVEEKI